MNSQILTFVLMLGFGTSAFAAGKPCEGHAKYAAIRAYHAEMGTVQGSEGIQYSADLLKTRGNVHEYSVEIADNNEDGEAWVTTYKVSVRSEANKRCQILNVKNVGSRDL